MARSTMAWSMVGLSAVVGGACACKLLAAVAILAAAHLPAQAQLATPGLPILRE